MGGGGQGAVRFQPINTIGQVSALLADSISGGRVGCCPLSANSASGGCACIKAFITRGVGWGGAIQS